MSLFNDETRSRLLVPMTLSFDPTGTTVEVKVGATWYAATWQGTAVSASGKWTQTARTTGYFAGPAVATPAGATVLPLGTYVCETRVTQSGGDTIAYSAGSLVVREL